MRAIVTLWNWPTGLNQLRLEFFCVHSFITHWCTAALLCVWNTVWLMKLTKAAAPLSSSSTLTFMHDLLKWSHTFPNRRPSAYVTLAVTSLHSLINSWKFFCCCCCLLTEMLKKSLPKGEAKIWKKKNQNPTTQNQISTSVWDNQVQECPLIYGTVWNILFGVSGTGVVWDGVGR